MSDKQSGQHFLIGVMFLFALFILGVVTLWVTEVPLVRSVSYVDVRFPGADSLQQGDDVRVSGIRIGEVASIEYLPAGFPEAPVLVRCVVAKSVQEVIGDPATKYSIQSLGPLGGRYLDIEPGRSVGNRSQQVLEAPPVGVATGDVFRQLGEALQKNPDLVGNISDAVREIRDTFKSVNQSSGLLGALVNDQEMRASFSATVTDLRTVVGSVKDDLVGDSGTISYLLRDPEGRQRVEGILRDGEKLFSTLSNDIEQERGIVGYLVRSEDGRDQLRASVANLREVLNELREGQGLIPRLIREKSIADDVENSVSDLHEVLHKANSGDGTLGQIVNSQEAWDELVRILVLARETIEDLREQAPVSTFVNAVFSVF